MRGGTACLDCHAGLLCIAGVARFYLRTMEEVYVYMQEGAWTSQMVRLDEEDIAQCPRVQAILNGEDWTNSEQYFAMSGTTKSAVQRRRRRAVRTTHPAGVRLHASGRDES